MERRVRKPLIFWRCNVGASYENNNNNNTIQKEYKDFVGVLS